MKTVYQDISINGRMTDIPKDKINYVLYMFSGKEILHTKSAVYLE